MNQNTSNESELAFGAKILASISGTSCDEAHERMAKVIKGLNSTTPDSLRDALEAAHRQREDEQWRTDPLRLMPWFDPNEWRWLIADILRSVADWIEP